MSGIFLPPTIAIDKSEVKKGETLTAIGFSAPLAAISVIVNSDNEVIENTTSDAQGLWTHTFDTAPLDYGDHTLRAKAKKAGDITTFSKALAFKVGTKNALSTPETKCAGRTDLDKDCRVNLVDYSILAYWYKRAAPPAHVDLSGDGKVDIVDFSIMAYYWTG